jgi:hypothetical protein
MVDIEGGGGPPKCECNRFTNGTHLPGCKHVGTIMEGECGCAEGVEFVPHTNTAETGMSVDLLTNHIDAIERKLAIINILAEDAKSYLNDARIAMFQRQMRTAGCHMDEVERRLTMISDVIPLLDTVAT